MLTELQALLGTVVILLALLSVQGALAPITHGFRWGRATSPEPHRFCRDA